MAGVGEFSPDTTIAMMSELKKNTTLISLDLSSMCVLFCFCLFYDMSHNRKQAFVVSHHLYC